MQYTLHLKDKGVQFCHLYSENYTREQVDVIFKYGLAGQNSLVVIISDELMTSFVFSFAASFNTKIHQYTQDQEQFVHLHKALRQDKAIEDNVSLYNYTTDVTFDVLGTHYDDQEIDIVFVETRIEDFTEFFEKIWPKMKSHSVLVIKHYNDDVVKQFNAYIKMLKYTISVPISISRGYLCIKKPVAQQRNNNDG